tara:strand:+ start:397 stop:810 length:414 start_codon:yes stop_codon:yes gene_type:complete
MTQLLRKSNLNLKASSILISNNIFDSSIHCAYYSTVQLMLHLLRSEFKKSDSDVDSESEQGSRNEKGFHNWLSNFFIKELMKKDFMLTRDFNKFVTTLKSSRVKADYKNLEIKESVAKQNLDLAKQINQLLQENFQI